MQAWSKLIDLPSPSYVGESTQDPSLPATKPENRIVDTVTISDICVFQKLSSHEEEKYKSCCGLCEFV